MRKITLRQKNKNNIKQLTSIAKLGKNTTL